MAIDKLTTIRENDTFRLIKVNEPTYEPDCVEGCEVCDDVSDEVFIIKNKVNGDELELFNVQVCKKCLAKLREVLEAA